MLSSRIFHQQQKFSLRFPRSLCVTTLPKTCVRHFSRCAWRFSVASCCLQRYKSPNFSSLQHSRTVRTSSTLRTLTSLNDAFSEANKERVVQQLGLMKPRKSLLASCSREAAVFVPFCIVDSVPSVLFTLRSSQLNNHRGEVRSVHFVLFDYYINEQLLTKFIL